MASAPGGFASQAIGRIGWAPAGSGAGPAVGSAEEAALVLERKVGAP